MIAVAGGILLVLVILAVLWLAIVLIGRGEAGCGGTLLLAAIAAILYLIF